MMGSDVEDEEENDFKGFPMDIDTVKVEGSELEMDDTDQLILPDGPPARINEDNTIGLDGKILPDRDEGSYSNDPVKREPLDIKDEMDTESDYDEPMEDLPREEDSSDGDLLLDQEADEDQDDYSGTSTRKLARSLGKKAEKLRRECKTRGLSYKSKSGRIIPARAVQPNCGAACKFQCRTRVSDEVRQQLLADLLRLPLSDQWKFINDHICITPSVRRQLASRRSLSYYYFLPVDSRLVKVCKKMFLNTYNLTQQIIHTIRSEKVADKHVVCGNPNFPMLVNKCSKFYFDYDESCDQTRVVPHKVQKDWCECNQQCGTMFPEEVIAQMQNSLLEKSEKELNDLLSRHVQLSIDESNQYKSALFRTRFFLPFESTAKEVCRKMFQNTFKLTTRQLRSLLNNLPENPDLPVQVDDSYEFAVSDAVARTDVVLCPTVPDGNGLADNTLPDDLKTYSLNEQVKHEPVDNDTETNQVQADHHEFIVVFPREDNSDNGQLLVAPQPDEPQNDNSDTDSEIIPSDIRGVASSSKKNASDIRKERKIRGLSYTSRCGLLIPARAVKPNCGATCKIQCRTRVPDEVRPQLLANLLQMPFKEQREFINDHVCNMPAANPRSLSGRRMLTCHYFLPVDSRLVKVCRTMFINTFDISKEVLFKNLAKKGADRHVVCGNPNFPPLLKKGSKFFFEYDEGFDQATADPQVVREERCECDLQCGSTFSEEVIEQIQSNYRKKTIQDQNKFLSKHVQLSTGKRKRYKYKNVLYQTRFFLPFGSTIKEVCRKVFVRTFKLTTGQIKTLLKNLSENPDLPGQADDSYEFAVSDVVPRTEVVLCPTVPDADNTLPDDLMTYTLNEQVKHEPVDNDTETNQVQTDHHEFIVVLPREDNSDNGQLLVAPQPDEPQNDNSDTDSEIIPSDIRGVASSSKKNASDIRKELKTRGLSYMSHCGLLIPARAVKPNCGATCKIQCRTRVPDEVRPQLLANLLQMPFKDQREFINDHICNMPAANPRSLSGRRMLTCHYFLPVDSRLVKVCRTMFINTFDISKVVLFKNLAKKGADRHVVCGNPNFPPLLKKSGKFIFEYDEGYDQATADSQEVREEGCDCDLQCGSTFSEEVIEQIQCNYRKKTIKGQNKFLSEHVQLSAGKRKRYKKTLFQARFFLPFGSTVKEVCRKVFERTFKLTTGQIKTLLNNLPENPNLPVEVEDPFELAKEHITALQMEEDHHCAVSGELWKLSHCPNVARVYSEYLEACQEGVEPIDYRQFYAEFSKTFTKTGLLLPPRCPDCGFFARSGGV